MNNKRSDYLSISTRFSIAFIGVVSFVLFLFAGVAISINSSKINTNLENRLENALKLSSKSLPTPLWNLDTAIVEDFIEALFLDEAMVYAELVWGEEVIVKRISPKVKARALEALRGEKGFIDRSTSILYEGKKIGTLRLVMSKASVRAQVARDIGGIVALMICTIVAIATTSLLITKKYITNPLLNLQSAAAGIARGNLDTLIEANGRDEISLLAEHLDEMRTSIKELFTEVNRSKEKIEDYSKTLEQKVEIRTQRLVRSVDELKALSEVSQVVSSTLDIETVLTRIIRQSVLLSRADGGTVFDFDEASQRFVPKVNFGFSSSFDEKMQQMTLTRGDMSAIGQASINLSPVQIPDLREAPHYPLPFVLEEGFRALLALPLVWKGQLIGGLVIQRKQAGEFPEGLVKLLRTFAAQSVLAIHNAKMYQELEEKTQQLEVADKHKSEFLANMSHELRTPLNAILGYTELMVDGIYGEVPEEIEDILNRLEKNGRHLLNLINDILDISKIEAGQFQLSIDEYSMAELVETVSISAEPLASEKDLELNIKVAEDLPIGRGDQQRLSQVLLNLLGNAIKFTEQGKLTVTVDLVNDNFLVAVSDTGKGLSGSDQAVIFKEFYQVDGSSTREKGGTGLGLSIAKKIVEMHKGHIWVESQPGEGSIFRFEIPVNVES